MTVYCVFYYENGAQWLDLIFKDGKEAQHYIESMPERFQANYKLQVWAVE